KTALISVPYVAAGEQASLRSRIRRFTSAGKLIKYREEPPAGSTIPEIEEPSDLHTEMDVVIEHLSNPVGTDLTPTLASAQSRHAVHQVWLPPLPKQLPLYTILQKGEHRDLDGRSWSKQPPFGTLRVPLGLLDMPLQQDQVPFIL